MKISVYIATSLDGFIARLDGAIDWLAGGDFDGPTEDYGYRAFMASVDVLVMGRHSFEKVLTFDQWPYEGKRVIVLSSRGVAIPAALRASVECRSAAPAELVRQLAAEGAQHLYIDGGKTVQGFLAAGRVDRLILTRIPVLIGSGLPLFGPLPSDLQLRHVATRAYASGLVQSEYTLPR
jgi:dihydrofolate reductase